MVVYSSQWCVEADFYWTLLAAIFLILDFNISKDFRKSIWDLKTVGDPWVNCDTITIIIQLHIQWERLLQFVNNIINYVGKLVVCTYFSVLITKQVNGKTSMSSENLWKPQKFSSLNLLSYGRVSFRILVKGGRNET